LALCSGPETEAFFAREEAPPALVIENYFLFGRPRFTAAMDKAMRRLLAEDQQEFFERATALLSQSPEPAAQALADQLVRQARGALAEQVRETRADYQRRGEYYERRCRELPVSPGGLDPILIGTCLPRWAQADWPATARLASMLRARPGASSVQQEEFAVLTRFASTSHRDAWAQERGLLPVSGAGREALGEPLSLAGRMLIGKRAIIVYPSMGGGQMRFSSRNDELLVTLAWRVDPELRGVVFEEDGHTLHAYADGERFSITTLDQGSWQDVGAVLALLNRLLEVRGSATRFAALGHRSPALTLVSGPASALKEADALGLLQLGDAREVVAWAMEHSNGLLKKYKEKAALSTP
jgi:hypothetical protein